MLHKTPVLMLFVLTEVHGNGGDWWKDLAKAVVAACQDHIADGRPFTPLFMPETPNRRQSPLLQKECTKQMGSIFLNGLTVS